MMAESFRELSNRITMMTDWVALVRAYQDYFDFKNAEVARLMERVSVSERRLSDCELRFAECQEN